MRPFYQTHRVIKFSLFLAMFMKTMETQFAFCQSHSWNSEPFSKSDCKNQNVSEATHRNSGP